MMNYQNFCRITPAIALMTGCSALAAAHFECLPLDETPDMLVEARTWTELAQVGPNITSPPPRLGQFQRARPAEPIPIVTRDGLNLTPVLVDIDPLGTPYRVPWTVHLEEIAIRDQPTSASRQLATLPAGTIIPGDYFLIEESDEEWLKVSHTIPNSDSDIKEVTGWITVTGLQRVHPVNAHNLEQFANLPIGEEIVNRWWGIPILYEAIDLAQVPPEYVHRNGDDAQLRQEARDSVIQLIDASRAAGEEVLVGSPYRSGALQKRIYDRNIKRSGRNQRYSAPPGHSEHQLGLTVDFTDPGDGRFLRNDDSEYLWMVENAPRFGWRQTYTADNLAETGYVEEPWHWRYIGVQNTMAWVFRD